MGMRRAAAAAQPAAARERDRQRERAVRALGEPENKSISTRQVTDHKFHIRRANCNLAKN
jgi:hypothetical protein